MEELFLFFQDILAEPAILVALIAFIGLVAQRKATSEVISGTIKTFVGFIIIGVGAGAIVGALEPFGLMFEEAFNMTGVVPNNEAIVSMALQDYGSVTALIMFFGMIANIFIARFTKFKYIFLTGHHTLYMACLIGIILISSGMSNGMTVLVGSIALGITMVVFPAMAQGTMNKITGGNEIGLGHFGTVGYVTSAYVGKVVGKGSKSTEEINFPKSLSFLRDSTVAISLTMIVMYVLIAVVAGQSYVETELSGGKNYIVYSIMQGATFAAGVYVILSGVRMVLNEILPAFKGISEKLIPGAKPAIDCPVAFPFAPNAVLIGFFCSFLGGLVGLGILVMVGGVLILPGVVAHFFTGATAGVFGNATGGIRGATIGSFVNGLIITFLPVLLMPVLGDLGFANTTFSDSDFGVVGIVLGKIGQISPNAIALFVFAVLGLLFVLTFASKKKHATE